MLCCRFVDLSWVLVHHRCIWQNCRVDCGHNLDGTEWCPTAVSNEFVDQKLFFCLRSLYLFSVAPIVYSWAVRVVVPPHHTTVVVSSRSLSYTGMYPCKSDHFSFGLSICLVCIFCTLLSHLLRCRAAALSLTVLVWLCLLFYVLSPLITLLQLSLKHSKLSPFLTYSTPVDLRFAGWQWNVVMVIN